MEKMLVFTISSIRNKWNITALICGIFISHSIHAQTYEREIIEYYKSIDINYLVELYYNNYTNSRDSIENELNALNIDSKNRFDFYINNVIPMIRIESQEVGESNVNRLYRIDSLKTDLVYLNDKGKFQSWVYMLEDVCIESRASMKKTKLGKDYLKTLRFVLKQNPDFLVFYDGLKYEEKAGLLYIYDSTLYIRTVNGKTCNFSNFLDNHRKGNNIKEKN